MNKPAPEIRTEEELPKENTPSVLPRLPRPAERKKRWGDRREGRLLHNLYAMNKFMPYIMPERSDGCNTYADEFDVTETDAFCKQMIAQGLENFSFLHVMLAAYVRTLSQKPAINRFIAGQRIYARNNIEIVMVIKKEMTSESPDTCIKVVFEPDDTVGEVYEKFDRAVEAVKATQALDSDFDKTGQPVGKSAAVCPARHHPPAELAGLPRLSAGGDPSGQPVPRLHDYHQHGVARHQAHIPSYLQFRHPARVHLLRRQAQHDEDPAGRHHRAAQVH